jgi:hypothetical protein
MKPDRFSSPSTRAAAVLLAGLLLAAGRPAAGQGISLNFNFGKKAAPAGSVKVVVAGVAEALAQQVGKVQTRFVESRRALRTVRGPGGEPAYPRQEVADLAAATEKDLDQAIEQVGEPGLDALEAWSTEELRKVREDLAATPGVRAAAVRFGPRVVAVVASLGTIPWRESVAFAAAAPPQETITAETSNRLLDQVGAVVGRIFFLAAHDDLEVTLWVGSTPAQKASFSYSSQGKVKGSTPAPKIIRTNNKQEHVLRGLYTYRAALGKGAVAELVEYPIPAGAPAAQPSERLDLVNGTSFFCCRFNEQYCHHVANEKECRP